MAIQSRRGPENELDKSKLLPAETATTLDTKKIFHAFAPGDVHQMATVEEMHTAIEQVTEDIRQDFTEQVEEATDNANMASGYATTQGDYAKAQGDYAYEKGQEAQTIVDSAAPIINTNLQATYADKGTLTGQSVQFPTADNGLVEITNIQGKYSQAVTVQGKQLFDKAKVSSPKYIQPTTGTETTSSFSNNASAKIYTGTETNVTISGHTYVQPNTPVGIAFYNSSNARIGGTSYQNATGNGTYAIPAGTFYLRYTINNVDLNTSQAEFGTVATPYATYIPNSPSPDYPSVIHNVGDAPFDIGANNGGSSSNTKSVTGQYGALPDGTHDEFVSDGTTAKNIQRIGKITYDGSVDEVWTQLTTATTGLYRYSIPLSAVTASSDLAPNKAVCTHFKLIGNGQTFNNIVGFTIISNQVLLYFDGRTLVDFKSWLSTHPIEFRYELLSPIESPRDRIFLTSYPGTTNVYTTDTLQPTFTAVAKSELWSKDYLINLGIKALQDGKINKTDIVNTDTVNDTTKVASAAVARALGIEIDTVNNNISNIFVQNKSLGQVFSNPGSTTDIRSLIHQIPSGMYIVASGELSNVTFPIAVGSGLLVNWFRMLYTSNGFHYGIIMVRDVIGSNNKTYICSIYNNTSYSAWSENG